MAARRRLSQGRVGHEKRVGVESQYGQRRDQRENAAQGEREDNKQGGQGREVRAKKGEHVAEPEAAAKDCEPARCRQKSEQGNEQPDHDRPIWLQAQSQTTAFPGCAWTICSQGHMFTARLKLAGPGLTHIGEAKKAFFDRWCNAIYKDRQNRAVFLPAGMEVFRALETGANHIMRR